jgi:hypothetical protein
MDAVNGWNTYYPGKIDLLYSANDWEGLDYFLQKVKDQAKPEQEIIIDISCHGSGQTGLLGLCDEEQDHWKDASLGLVVNHIRQFLPEERVTLILDACYAPLVYEHSLRTYYTTHTATVWTETYDEKDIPFPVYGIRESKPNLFRLTLESYLAKDFELITDLRQFDDPFLPVEHDLISKYKMNLKFHNLDNKIK